MNIIRDFFGGAFSVVKIVGAPLLYRYPYRTSAEGLHKDWRNIGDDIENVMGELSKDKDNG